MAKKFLLIISMLIIICSSPLFAKDSDDYDNYVNRIEHVQSESDIEINGFEVLHEQRYPFIHNDMGLIELIPSIDRKHGRVVLFFADSDGYVVFKTDKLESNTWFHGKLNQPNIGVSGVGFRDLNGDGREDLIIVCRCVNNEGEYAFRPYNVGDALFQNESGFYRDWRISDKLNRFDMNKDIDAVTAFVRDGKSMEFLYTSKTFNELVNAGFTVINEQSFTAHFETFGVVRVITGFYNLSGQSYLMVYIVGEDGNIVWNFQPMGDYVNFYSIKGISFTDIDGDGLKDITILANYVTYDEDGKVVIKADYNIYYQRTGYFLEDVDIKRMFHCSDDDNLNSVSQNAKLFWGRRQ